MDYKQRISLKPWGNSQGIMISKTILKGLGVTNYKDQEFELEVIDKKLIVKKIDSSSRLMARFHNLLNEEPEDKNLEYDWGEPRGNELF